MSESVKASKRGGVSVARRQPVEANMTHFHQPVKQPVSWTVLNNSAPKKEGLLRTGPEPPTAPCWYCQGEKWWRGLDNQWICAFCHPRAIRA